MTNSKFWFGLASLSLIGCLGTGDDSSDIPDRRFPSNQSGNPSDAKVDPSQSPAAASSTTSAANDAAPPSADAGTPSDLCTLFFEHLVELDPASPYGFCAVKPVVEILYGGNGAGTVTAAAQPTGTKDQACAKLSDDYKKAVVLSLTCDAAKLISP